MKMKVMRIENPTDIGDTAYRIAEEIAREAGASGEGEATTEGTGTSTEADNLSRQEHDAIMETEEFNEFKNRLIELLDGAADLIRENAHKYNCSLFTSVTFLDSNIGIMASSATMGRRDSIVEGLSRQMESNPTTREVIAGTLFMNLIKRSKK